MGQALFLIFRNHLFEQSPRHLRGEGHAEHGGGSVFREGSLPRESRFRHAGSTGGAGGRRLARRSISDRLRGAGAKVSKFSGTSAIFFEKNIDKRFFLWYNNSVVRGTLV